MRKIVTGSLLILGWLLGFTGHALTIVKDIKRDFGALGNGVTNDQAAFDRASLFLNTLYNGPDNGFISVKLVIPRGTYIVGRQDPMGTTGTCWEAPDNNIYKKGKRVLDLRNCHNLLIEGEDTSGVTIRYADDLWYGSFDPQTGQPSTLTTAYNRAATMGTCIYLDNCYNVTVSNLKLDGNSRNYTIGGPWGDTGIQLEADGIFIKNSTRISVQFVHADYFGRDGIQINNTFEPYGFTAYDELTIFSSSFLYNGRQGMSLIGTNQLYAYNSRFSGTGRAVNAHSGNGLFSQPGFGIDIEPEANQNSHTGVSNVTIDACQIINNFGGGIDAERHSSAIYTSNIKVLNSTIWQTNTPALYVSQPGLLFKNDDIYGFTLHGCDADNVAQATRFKNCRFEDKNYGTQYMLYDFLLNPYGNIRRMSFDSCRFTTNRNTLVYAAAYTTSPDEYFRFKDCEFVYNQSQAPTTTSQPIFHVANFPGNNVFHDGPSRTYVDETSITFDNAFAAYAQSQEWGSVQLLAPKTYSCIIGGVLIGKGLTGTDSANVVVGRDNTLILSGPPQADSACVYIGPNATLRIKKGGSLEAHAKRYFRIAGQLIVEDSAYVCIDPNVTFTMIGSGRVRIAAQAIIGRHPTRYAHDYSYACRESFDICVEGGNPAITSCSSQRSSSSTASTPSGSNSSDNSNRLTVTPNPVSDNVRITVTTPSLTGQGQLNIFDITGRCVYSRRMESGVVEISSKQYPAGAYNIIYTHGATKLSARLQKE